MNRRAFIASAVTAIPAMSFLKQVPVVEPVSSVMIRGQAYGTNTFVRPDDNFEDLQVNLTIIGRDGSLSTYTYPEVH